MHLNDWLAVAATLSAIVAAIYAVIAYHFPRAKPVVDPSPILTPAKSPPRNWIPILCVFIAWGAIITDLIDRHSFSAPAAAGAETSLSTDNARMEVSGWIFTWNSENPRQYIANMIITNNGKADAIGMRNLESIVLSPLPLNDKAIDVYFAMIKAQFALQNPPPKSEIHPGARNVWFSAFSDPQLTDVQVSAIKGGGLIPYALSVMQYKDEHILSDEFIYTESCAFHLKDGAVHNCDRGDNVSYISN